MSFKAPVDIAPKLDQRKLLGFRNLSSVKTSADSLVESSDLAFNKVGSEVPPAKAG